MQTMHTCTITCYLTSRKIRFHRLRIKGGLDRGLIGDDYFFFVELATLIGKLATPS